MTHRRQTQQNRISMPAGHVLVVLLTMLAIVVTPLGNVLATPAPQDDDYQFAQDGNENPTEEPPVESQPTEVPVESKPTEQPPVESQLTEVPVESKPTEEPVETKPTEVPVESKPTEQPAIDPTPDEAQPTEPSVPATPPDLPPNTGGPRLPAPSTLVMVTGLCDYGVYNYFAAANLAQLLANCIPYSSSSTFLYTADTGTRMRQATSGGTTSFAVQSGGFSMQAMLPADHYGYVVGCESTGVTGYPIFRPGNGSIIRTVVDPGATLTCYWFTSPVPPTTITLIKGLCDDPGFDPYSATDTELAANCTQATGDATFTYQELYTELTLIQSTSGSTTTFLPPPGNYTIWEDIPAGYGAPVVSCQVARAYFTFSLPNPIVDRLRGHMDPGDALTCQWYNVAIQPTTLVVVKGLCEGNRLDVYAARSLAELNRLCVTYSTDATFTYTYLDTGTASTQGTIGSTTSFDVQPGSFSLREQLPPGYDSPVVACVSDTIGEYPLFRPGNGSTITSHIDAGDTLTCYWLNVPIPPTHIVVTKGLCDDPSFDPYTASTAELAANCTGASGDATFTYQQTNTGGPNELTLTQTTVSRTTTFDVPPGNFTLREDVPAGYGEPVVSCHIGLINVDILPNVQGDTIQGHVDLGVTWTCHWYNVSLGSDSHLFIEKWQCPAGYDVAMPGANPVRDCTQPLDGVEFQVEGIENGASFSAVTGEVEPGVVAFPDLEPGDYAITEIGSDDHAAAFVWTCTTAGIPASPTTPLSMGNTLTVTTVASWNTICHWYNIQAPVPPGSLTVTKYLCGSLSQQTFLLCPIYKFGQSFDLLQWSDDGWVLVGTGVTDRSGRYTWTDLPPGDYMLDEKRGDWCRLTSDNLDPGGTTIAVRSGEEARVSVYNCGMPPTSAPVRVVSLLGLIFRDIWNPAP